MVGLQRKSKEQFVITLRRSRGVEGMKRREGMRDVPEGFLVGGERRLKVHRTKGGRGDSMHKKRNKGGPRHKLSQGLGRPICLVKKEEE